MTNPICQADDRELLQHQAIEWISKISLDGASEADIAALRAWRDESSAHASAFAAASRTWRALNPALEVVRHQDKAAFQPRQSPSPVFGRRAILGGLLGGAAAAAAGVVIVRPPFELWPSLAEFSADYRTGTGEQRALAVGNVASVELNTATSITMSPDGNQEAGFELIAGEAAIVKPKTTAAAFVVTAGNGRVIAHDATFNIRRDGASVCVTCIAGNVRIEVENRSATTGKGQQITYGASGMGLPVAVDSDAVAAWRDGMLVFHNLPVARLIEEVNRYRPGRIVLLNEALGRREISARFELDRLDDVIVQMDRVFGAKVTQLPGGLVILS